MHENDLNLSIIIVNYNGKEFLRKCLKSVYAETSDLDFEVFVVDNNSQDSDSEMIKKLFPRVHLIQNSENVGFAKANNQAILKSRGRYILLLNPDTVALPNAITNLVEFMETYPDAEAVGCKLLNLDGSIQYSIRNFPSLFSQLSECFFLHRIFPRNGLFGEVVSDERHYETAQAVDWVCGAVLMLGRETIDRIGMLDENFFLYSEEKDWCYRVWRAGGKVYYCPGAQFIHYQGESETDPKLFAELVRSKVRFFRKHKSIPESWVYRVIFSFSLLLRVGGWLLAAIIDSGKNGKARCKLNVYLKGFQASLSPISWRRNFALRQEEYK